MGAKRPQTQMHQHKNLEINRPLIKERLKVNRLLRSFTRGQKNTKKSEKSIKNSKKSNFQIAQKSPSLI